MISTRLTKIFGLRFPIVSAPMAMMSGGNLAAAVSKSGGLGTFGGVCARPFEIPLDYLKDNIARVRAATDNVFGVGFITHHIEDCPQNFELVLSEDVPVILLSFADPTPWLSRIKAKGVKAICQVQTMEDARIAVSEGADVLAIQGNEAGGHCGELNLLPFLAQALDTYPQTPIIAAGGIACGRSLAAVLAAGADGAWVGTGFRATRDCTEISEAERAEILKSDGQNTVRHSVYDTITRNAFRFLPWPTHIGLRSKTNSVISRWQGRESDLAHAAAQSPDDFRSVYDDPEAETYPHIFGESAGFINRVETAAEFMSRITEEATRMLQERA